MRQIKLASLEKKQAEITGLFLSLSLLTIFAFIGVLINFNFCLTSKLPESISPIEYLVLTLAMVLFIPVFLIYKRKMAEYKKLKDELLESK
jgi:uncharacterized membrane protein